MLVSRNASFTVQGACPRGGSTSRTAVWRSMRCLPSVPHQGKTSAVLRRELLCGGNQVSLFSVIVGEKKVLCFLAHSGNQVSLFSGPPWGKVLCFLAHYEGRKVLCFLAHSRGKRPPYLFGKLASVPCREVIVWGNRCSTCHSPTYVHHPTQAAVARARLPR